MPEISVITPTNRYGGIDIAYSSLKRQSFQDFEWILVDELYDVRKDAVREYVVDVPLIHLKPSPRHGNNATGLNAAYNDALRRATGRWIVSYQDYIYLPGYGLQRFMDAVDRNTAVSGVGHKAMYPNEIHDPKGLITVFKEPFTERPTGISELDTRMDGKHDCVQSNYSYFELNWCCAPRQMYYDVGGMAEELDGGYGADNLGVALKASLLGYNFYYDKSNECIGFNQALFPRPHDWEPRHNNKGGYARWAAGIHAGTAYPRYL